MLGWDLTQVNNPKKVLVVEVAVELNVGLGHIILCMRDALSMVELSVGLNVKG